MKSASGGDAGASVGGAAGTSGSATDALTIRDMRAGDPSLSANLQAAGGLGGAVAGKGAATAGGGASAATTLTGANIVSAQSTATGGDGGSGADAASGGAGGAANASASATGGRTTSATANARGGAGGVAANLADGGDGGAAKAAAVADHHVSAGSAVTGAATADGGDGGDGYGAGYEAGNGGAAKASAQSASYGASSIALTATADGGGGGAGDGGADGGDGGGASASVSIDDPKDPTAGAHLTGLASATGGDEGYAGGGGLNGASGGDATASSIVIGSATAIVTSTANAAAGLGGVENGAASATAHAIGGSVDATATATAGNNDGSAGAATASLLAEGVSGHYSANASSLGSSGALSALSASVSGDIDGAANRHAKAIGFAAASFGVAVPAFSTGDQGIATEVASPSTAAVGAALADDGKIRKALGASPSYFAIGEIGGARQNGGAGSETVDEQLKMTISPGSLVNPKNLLIGFYGDKALGSGFYNLTIAVNVNGLDVRQPGLHLVERGANLLFRRPEDPRFAARERRPGRDDLDVGDDDQGGPRLLHRLRARRSPRCRRLDLRLRRPLRRRHDP